MMVGSGAVDGHQIAQVRMPSGSWVDTGYYPSSSTKVECGVILLYKYRYSPLFGAREATNTNQFVFQVSDDVTKFSASAYSTHVGSADTFSLDLKPYLTHYDISMDSNEVIINNASYTLTSSNQFTSPKSMLINGNNGQAVYPDNIWDYFKIYDNGTLVRDYIPWEKTNGEQGMLDRVNGVFYGSATNVPFGEALPSGYTRLHYITCDGQQGFMSGFTANQADSFYARFYPTQTPLTSSFNLFGSQASSTSRRYDLRVGYANDLYYGNGTNSANALGQFIGNDIISFRAYDTFYTIKNGTYLSNVSRSPGTFTSPEIAICHRNNNGTRDSYFYGNVKEICINGKGWYLPCTDPNGYVGLYDKVSNTFKRSTTGVEFIAGTIYGQ